MARKAKTARAGTSRAKTSRADSPAPRRAAALPPATAALSTLLDYVRFSVSRFN